MSASTFRTLWLLWAVALSGGLVYGLMVGHGQPLPLAGRMISSVLLVVTGVLIWREAGGKTAAGFAGLITLGMAFGTLGDFFNAGLLGRDMGTLQAMAAFGTGHLCYIAAAVREIRAGDSSLEKNFLPVGFWLLAGALGWWLIVYRAEPGPGLLSLVWPALGYSLLLSATAGAGSALGLMDARFRPLALGAILFLLSDMVLAVEIFRGPFAQDTLAVWIPYGCGQMLIVFSAVRLVVGEHGVRGQG